MNGPRRAIKCWPTRAIHCWVCWCSTAVRSQCDFLAVRFSSSANFLATIWPLIKILRSLVVHVNDHNKNYLRKTPCDWLCGDDAALFKFTYCFMFLIILTTIFVGFWLSDARICLISLCAWVHACDVRANGLMITVKLILWFVSLVKLKNHCFCPFLLSRGNTDRCFENDLMDAKPIII